MLGGGSALAFPCAVVINAPFLLPLQPHSTKSCPNTRAMALPVELHIRPAFTIFAFATMLFPLFTFNPSSR